jgi:hypothetical protein
MSEAMPIFPSSNLTVYPRLAIDLNKVLYACSVGDAGHVEVVFEGGQPLLLTSEEAQASCFGSLITPVRAGGAL